ncbi:histidine kinase dimerization/phospho-acceptor domain-containing protein [Salinicola salarius]|uniref:sensor histidine kinase n=1 Tax=Salinicola salarius TaxID=430457 RepID=UPI0023E3811F|nr:sensor histidine kinase [Salinicola salarius]MDF3918496.1 histidine kinase dimerization/phospho-acceptor domain-containing protein [Salinicola salarius]
MTPMGILHRAIFMTTKLSRRWRPRSLLQLVLLAFVVVMLPIAVLMFQAGQALSQLSTLADQSAREAVEETRRARMLSTLALQMERSARQYAVIEEEGLRDIYDQKVRQFGELLQQHESLMRDNPDFQSLAERYQQLRYLPQASVDDMSAFLERFSGFASESDAVRKATNDLIDTRIANIREQADAVKARLWMQTAALVSASLMLMLFFTWLITRPIRQLERRIFGLGSGECSDTPIRIQGPAELVQLGDRLTWLSGRLSELEAQKQQFLRHMSHELKTPLTSVREGTSLLSDGVAGELNERQSEVVRLIDENGQELQTLIEQLLDYNLLQNSRRMKVTSFDVATVIQEVLSKHRLALDNKGMRIKSPHHPLKWQADRERTARVLDNLISNAIAYGDDGGQLVIRVSNQHDWLVLDVANSGEPIAEADREHLFEAFYQGSVRRKGPLKGSGIGLSVAADCAKLQDGQLALVDDAELPVCFRLTLPWADFPTHGTQYENDAAPDETLPGGDSRKETWSVK